MVCAVNKLFFNRISSVDTSRQHTVQLLTNGFLRSLKSFSKFPASCYDFVRGRAFSDRGSYHSSTLYFVVIFGMRGQCYVFIIQSDFSEHGPLSYSCICTTNDSGHTSCVINPETRCGCSHVYNSLSSSLATQPSCVFASAAGTFYTSNSADPDLKQFMIRGNFMGHSVNVLINSGATTSFVNSTWCE